MGEVGGWRPLAALHREVHLDPRGSEVYDCGEEYFSEAVSSDSLPAAAAGSLGSIGSGA